MRFIFLLLFTFSVYADETISLSLKKIAEQSICSESQDGALEYSGENGLIVIKIRGIYSTPVISERVVCMRFLEDLKKEIKNQATETIIVLQKASLKEDNSVYFDSNGYLENTCLKFGLCKNSFLDKFELDPVLRKCTGSPNMELLLEQSVPRLLKTKTKIIHEITPRIHPLEPLTEFLKNAIKNPLNSRVYASTMTLGGATIQSLAELLGQYPGLTMNIGFNLETLLTDVRLDFLNEAFRYNRNVQLVPFTTGLNFGTIYHMKYVSIPERSLSALSAMNLSNPENSRYLDLIYEFKDPLIAQEFAALNAQNLTKQCRAMKDLICLLDFYSASAASKKFLLDNISRSCAEDPGTAFSPTGYFAYSGTHDLEKMVVDFIRSARHEIILFSYRLSHPLIISELKKARARGVKLTVITAYKSSGFDAGDPDHIYYDKNSALSMNYPHLKAILKDGEQFLFGTANFSSNAINSAQEIMAVSDNKDLIKLAYALAAVFTQTANMPLSKSFSPEKKQTHYIVFDSNQSMADFPDLLSAEQPWMSAYRLPNARLEEQITSCKLDHLLFINSATLKNCLKLHG